MEFCKRGVESKDQCRVRENFVKKVKIERSMSGEIRYRTGVDAGVWTADADNGG